MLDINQFKSAVHKHDLERPNLFAVNIPVPTLIKVNAPDKQLLTLFCKSANLPGVNLRVAETLRYGIGPSLKMPVTGLTNDITLTFISDAQGKLHGFFQDWIAGIFPMYGRNVVGNTPGSRGTYQLEYKENYQVDMSIDMYKGETGKFQGSGVGRAIVSAVSAAAKVPFVGALINGLGMDQHNLVKARTYKFSKAYPYNITDISLSHMSSNVISEFGVTFTYQSYEVSLPT